jgi:hypothetical protein
MPNTCTQCGAGTFVKGIENLSYDAKQELAEINRRKNNKIVTKSWGLKKS